MATIDKYDSVLGGCTASVEMLENLKKDVFENMNPSDPFKEYLLDELSKVQMMVIDTQRAFNEGYCLNPKEKMYSEAMLADKMNSINDEINKNGLSL